MIWNIVIHVGAGAIGYKLFAPSIVGLLFCFAFAAVAQGISTYRFQQYSKQRYESSLAGEDKRWEELANVKSKLVQLYFFKVIFYGGLMLLSAYLTRTYII